MCFADIEGVLRGPGCNVSRCFFKRIGSANSNFAAFYGWSKFIEENNGQVQVN